VGGVAAYDPQAFDIAFAEAASFTCWWNDPNRVPRSRFISVTDSKDA
jgi:hypothetical protein